MTREDYLAGVAEHMYRGEVMGEAVFAAYAALEADPERRNKWANCLQLETETKARLRPFLVRLGLPLTEQDTAPTVAGASAAYPGRTWTQHMEAMVQVTDQYLERFRELEAAAPAEEREICASMVAHEEALNVFGRRELAGEGERSLELVLAQLQWPIGR